MDQLENVAIAGIFDRFHAGHKQTIKEGLEKGKKLYIFLLASGDQITHPNKTIELVRPYEERLANIKAFVKEIGVEDRVIFADKPLKPGLPPLFGWEIFRDLDELGWIQCQADYEAYKCLGDVFDYIRTVAYRKPPIKYFWIPAVTDEKGERLSASKIRREELLKGD